MTRRSSQADEVVMLYALGATEEEEDEGAGVRHVGARGWRP
jgi:hypothetical protein